VVKGYAFIHDSIRYTLVDTPGFDDTFESDQVITDKILSWLNSFYRPGTRLNGILYLHSIALPKMQGSAFDSLDMFRKLCGTNALSHVVLATTFWSSTETVLGENRARELAQNDAFWGRMIKNGSRILRLENSAISAMKALWEVSKASKIMLQAQEEMAEGGRPPERTTAAQFLAPITADGRDTWYTERLKRQKEEEIKQIQRLEEMQMHLNSIDDTLAKVMKKADLERMRLCRSRQSYYKSHKCHCQLMGRAKCTKCRRKIGKLFYRKFNSSSTSHGLY
jgi:hypothetical protein